MKLNKLTRINPSDNQNLSINKDSNETYDFLFKPTIKSFQKNFYNNFYGGIMINNKFAVKKSKISKNYYKSNNIKSKIILKDK